MRDWLLKPLGAVAGLVPRSVALRMYTMPWAARAVRGLLNAFVAPGLREVVVARGRLSGTRLELDLTQEKFLWLGTYEPWVQDVLARVVVPGKPAWDVGAFIGYHTLLMCTIAGPRFVVAIEPDPYNRARLERNLVLNDANAAVVIPAAAGASAGRARLARVSGRPSDTSVGNRGIDECEVVTLDDLLTQVPPPVFVKLDVEGGELDVLRGARDILSHVRPTWLVELHGNPAPTLSVLRHASYRVSWLGKGVDVPTNLPVGGPRHVLAVPE